jgi:hypothetical protein
MHEPDSVVCATQKVTIFGVTPDSAPILRSYLTSLGLLSDPDSDLDDLPAPINSNWIRYDLRGSAEEIARTLHPDDPLDLSDSCPLWPCYITASLCVYVQFDVPISIPPTSSSEDRSSPPIFKIPAWDDDIATFPLESKRFFAKLREFCLFGPAPLFLKNTTLTFPSPFIAIFFLVFLALLCSAWFIVSWPLWFLLLDAFVCLLDAAFFSPEDRRRRLVLELGIVLAVFLVPVWMLSGGRVWSPGIGFFAFGVCAWLAVCLICSLVIAFWSSASKASRS